VPRGYHHGDLRNALLDAAQALVAEGGLAAVTMSKVAARSNVSSGAPYRHFKDRSALLRALHLRAQKVANDRMDVAAAGAPDPVEAFRRRGVEYVRFAVDEPALFTLLSSGEYVDRDTANPQDVAFSNALAELLGKGSKSAELDPKDPVLGQLAARCLVHGLAHFFVDGGLAALGIGSEQAGRLADALTLSSGPPPGVAAAGGDSETNEG